MIKRRAHAELIEAIKPDLPLLMHGSGDVHMDDVDPGSLSLLADLTASYISNLVSVAVDAHDVLTDGSGVSPPTNITNNEAKSNTNENEEKEDGDWDVSLPPSKRNKSINDKPNEPNNGNDDDVNWIGALGIDALSSRRRPKPSSSIGTQCFMFPMYHDAALCGRVIEVQAARRKITPVIMDQTMLDMIKEEGSSTAASNGSGDNGEGGAANWPFDNSFLPIY